MPPSDSLPSPSAAASAAARPRVLVADDSRVIRLAIKKILAADFEVILTGDGATAWDCLRQDGEIQALITDIEMPGLDGYDLICRLRGAEEASLRDLPVIAITGAEDEQTKQRAFACGATDFITKPIDGIQLQARVRAYVKLDRTTRELVQKSVELREQAIMDPMTGLRSRRYFMQRGEQDLAFARRRGKDLAVIRVEIDGFKKIYQDHGDELSDRLLIWLAEQLSTNARIEDTVARVGGAEFAILASATDSEAALKLCDRLREAIARKPFVHGGLRRPITLSMGVASLVQDRSSSLEDLLKLAEQRLCHAQSEGGNRACASVMGETALAIEEVLLSPVEPQPPSAEAVEIAVEALSVEELENLVKQAAQREAGDAAEPVTSAPGSVPTAPAAPAEPVSVDKALQMLASGQGADLIPWLEELVRRVQPLLDFYGEFHKQQTTSTEEAAQR